MPCAAYLQSQFLDAHTHTHTHTYTRTHTHTLRTTLYIHTNVEPEGNEGKAAETTVSLLPGGSVTESHFRN